MGKSNSLKKNIIYNLVYTSTNILFPMITFPYLSRTLGPEGYGIINFSLSIIGYFIVFSQFGIYIYGTRQISKSKNKGKNELKTVFSNLFITNIFLSFCSFLILSIYIYFDSSISDYRLILYILGMQVLFQFLKVDWFFKGMEEFDKITKISITTRTINLILIFIFINNKTDYLNYAVIILFIFFLNHLIMLFYIYKKNLLIFKINLNVIFSNLKLMSFIAFMVITTKVYLSVDTIMIGYILGPTKVGLYTVAMKFNKLVLAIISSISLVIFPKISSLLEKNQKDKANKILNKSLHIIILIAIPSSFGLFILSEDLILVFSGIEYIDSLLTMRIMSILITIITFSTIILNQIIYPRGLERKTIKMRWIGLVANIILNYFLIHKLGIVGAGIASIVTEFIVMLQLFYFSKNVTDLFIKTSSILKYIFSSLIMMIFIGFFINVFQLSNILNIIFFIPLGALIYFILLYCLKDRFLFELIINIKERL
jgi:O-antigen/teichoic acid export membrane protein